jgi:hypothetical protein
MAWARSGCVAASTLTMFPLAMTVSQPMMFLFDQFKIRFGGEEVTNIGC